MTDSDDGFSPQDGREARRHREAETHETQPQPASSGDPGHIGVETEPEERSPRGGRRSRAAAAFRGTLAVLLVTLLALGLLVYWALSPVSDSSLLVEFEVQPGWGASRVAQELEREGLVRNSLLFSVYLRVRGLDRSIGEGLYDLDRASSAADLAAALERGGRPRVAQVLLPEGMRAGELAKRLEAAGLGLAERYTALIGEPGELRPQYLPVDATLEGYLFPASYEIPYAEEPQAVLSRMLKRFERELDEEVRAQLQALDMRVHEWVTLASIVQAEAGSDDEMQVIAGVFLNRLDLGMALQSDPTVAYGLGKSLPELDPLAGDIRKDHPWNTYTRPGLPRGPISNPGRAALRAVLAPQRRDERGRQYLYFLHGMAGGEPVFRPNTGLDGHNRDVDLYLRGNRVSDPTRR
jgi:UPF0755 protein